MIPEYDVVVIDEAHELSARVTQAATDELSRAGGRAGRPALAAARRGHRGRRPRRRRRRAARRRSTSAGPAGSTRCPSRAGRRAGAGPRRRPGLLSAFPKESRPTARPTPGRTQARGAVQEVFANAERMAANSEADVLWLAERERNRGGDQLCVAPLQVWGPLRDKLLTDKTVVLTSATLMLGGDFDAVATSLGLKPAERVDHSLSDAAGRAARRTTTRCRGAASTSGRRSTTAGRRSCTSPGTCRRPGRDGLGAGPARRDRRPGRRRRRPHARAVLQPARRRGRGRGGPRAAAAPDHPGPGRGAAARAGPAVRRGPARLPVRHAEPVAGPRRAGRHLPAGADRPDPVPAARRPADVARASGRPTRPAATASCRSPRPTPRCCSRRAPAG